MPPLEERVREGPQRPLEYPPPTPSLNTLLDRFLAGNRGRARVDMMVGFLRQLDADRNDSILLMAELSYIFLKDGNNTRMIYSSVHNCWFI